MVQKQTRKVEEAEKVFVRGIRELSEMEQIDQSVCGENRGEQKRGGLGQLIVIGEPDTGHMCAHI